MSRSLLLPRRLSLLVAAAALGACSLDVGSPDRPANLIASASSNQTVKTGTPATISVFVLNTAGETLKGVTVNFSAVGAGALSASTVSTDTDGRATATFTPSQAGASQISVSTGDLQALKFIITALDVLP